METSSIHIKKEKKSEMIFFIIMTDEYFYLKKWKKMKEQKLEDKILRTCCVCKTALLPDGTAISEYDAKKQGYQLTHGILSRACIVGFIEDTHKGMTYDMLPERCPAPKSSTSYEEQIDANMYEDDKIFRNDRG